MIALISVHDKAGVQEFARSLAELGFDIYSTGGTQKHLSGGGLAVQSVSKLTGFPEILDGRVKTLHPMVHGGILARRDRPEQMEELARSEIPPIDIVCVNLYPFVETVAKPDVSLDDVLEKIDIGGPTMLRAAAKNYRFVLVLVDPSDYAQALDHLRADAVPLEFRRRLAEKAFQHVASYDTAIAQYLRSGERGEESFPERMTVALDKALDLRYGENPHQRAALYREERVGQDDGGIVSAEKLHGLELSYINVMDADAAWQAVSEFSDPAVVILKHANPCGIASHDDIAEAYRRAFDSDPMSPFGGIVAANRAITAAMAAAMKGMRYDVTVAPDYEAAALERLRKRRDLRILRMPEGGAATGLDYRRVSGGLLVQEADRRPDDGLELRVVTKRAPTATELADLRFAWKAAKHVKSNAIVVAKERATVGIGAASRTARRRWRWRFDWPERRRRAECLLRTISSPSHVTMRWRLPVALASRQSFSPGAPLGMRRRLKCAMSMASPWFSRVSVTFVTRLGCRAPGEAHS